MDEVECDLWCALGPLDGSDDSLFWDLEREKSLGGEREERVGKGDFLWLFGVRFVLEGVEVFLFLFCFSFSGERWGAAHCREEGDFGRYFSGEFSEVFSFVFFIVCFSGFSIGGWAENTSLLLVFLHSLLLFKSTKVSISSGCSSSIVFCPFLSDFFWWGGGDEGWVVVKSVVFSGAVVVSVVVASVVAAIVSSAGFVSEDVAGEFFFLVSKVHPFSWLSG